MVVNKPTIIIYTNEPDQEFLHEICSGIEEEGLLYEIHERDMDTLEDMVVKSCTYKKLVV